MDAARIALRSAPLLKRYSVGRMRVSEPCGLDTEVAVRALVEASDVGGEGGEVVSEPAPTLFMYFDAGANFFDVMVDEPKFPLASFELGTKEIGSASCGLGKEGVALDVTAYLSLLCKISASTFRSESSSRNLCDSILSSSRSPSSSLTSSSRIALRSDAISYLATTSSNEDVVLRAWRS